MSCTTDLAIPNTGRAPSCGDSSPLATSVAMLVGVSTRTSQPCRTRPPGTLLSTGIFSFRDQPIPRVASARIPNTDTAEPTSRAHCRVHCACNRPAPAPWEVRLSDPSQLFRSFWMGGFEGACHRNRVNKRLDLIAATQHDVLAASDYALVKTVGIETVRDGVRWPHVDRGGRYEFSSFVPMLRAALAERVQVIWTLCHYGWPEELDVFSAAWVDRFARYCGAVARVVADHTDQVPCYSPINEISFLCWAAGDTGGFIHPHARGRGNELKRQLARAAVAGIDAIWAVDRRARIVHVDPVIKVFPPRNRPDLAVAAEQYTQSQFEAWDMLSGRTEPQLGGRAD